MHDLNSMRFADSPFVVRIDGANYARSIQKVNPDGSLTFFCAIEEGLELRVAHGVGLVDNLDQTFSGIRDELDQPQLLIACDCILRKLEIAQNGLDAPVAGIFQSHNTVDFSSYGELFHGVHVNQTLTGIAIGSFRDPVLV